MNKRGAVPLLLIIGVVVSLLAFGSLAVVGISLFQFLEENFMFILFLGGVIAFVYFQNKLNLLGMLKRLL